MIGRLRYHIPTLGSVAIRMLGVALGFASVILIGRSWGPEGNGIYGLVSQTSLFLSTVAIGGLDIAAVRHLSGLEARQRAASVGSVIKLIGLVILLLAIPLSVILIGGGPLLTWATGTALGPLAVAALAVVLIARGLARVISAILRAKSDYLIGQLVDGLLLPGLLFAILLLGLAESIQDLLRWMMATALIAVVISVIIMMLRMRDHRRLFPSESVAMRPIFATALPLWGVTVSLSLADWYGLAVVTAQLGLAEAGIYRVVMQFATSFAIISAGLFGVYSAKIGAAQSKQDWPAVARLVRSATWLSAAMVIPAAALLILVARPVLAFVGPEFLQATLALQLALVGQIIFVSLGPAGLTLAMTGHGRINLAITLISTLALLIIAPMAAYQFGTIGVVACISVLLVSRNLASLMLVRKVLGINALTGRFHPKIN